MGYMKIGHFALYDISCGNPVVEDRFKHVVMIEKRS
jgi:hypothetical protein